MRAQKLLNFSKTVNGQFNHSTRDAYRNCYNKAIEYYKRALKHSRTPRDKARMYLLITQVYMLLVPRCNEKEAKSKNMNKCIAYLNQCMLICSDFDEQILNDIEQQIKSLLVRQVI